MRQTYKEGEGWGGWLNGRWEEFDFLDESLLVGEVGGAKPESANGEAESPGTGECPPPTYLKSSCSLERLAETNQSLLMASLNPPGQEILLPLLT
jgi:hypothetical protein